MATYVKTSQMRFDFAPDQLKPQEVLSVSTNLKRLNELLKSVQADAVILTAKDPFLSEYVPQVNHHRYGATGFKGSTGDCVYWSDAFRANNPHQKPVSLFVDGRYHLQADQETDPAFVEVVKLQVEPNIEESIFECFVKTKKLTVAIDPERFSVAQLNAFKKIVAENQHKLVFLKGEDILRALGLPGWVMSRAITSLPQSMTGRLPSQILDGLNEAVRKDSGVESTLHMTCSADDAAFLLNARGYHLPKHSSVLAYTFLFQDEIVLFLPAASAECEVKIDTKSLGHYQLSVIRNNMTELRERLKFQDVTHVYFNGAAMNGLLPSLITEIYPAAKVNADFKWIIQTRVRKTNEEMDSIRSSFLRSSRAIAKTLRFGKKETALRDVSELEIADYLYDAYAAEGALSLSFTTISGAGPNSAIVHYSSPKDTNYYQKGQLALLDSGAYYEEGFATDCTRGFFVGASAGAKPEAWQKDIYTSALKAAISVFLAPVDAKLSGKQVDDVVRSQVKAAGYDYLHGTGHGIGIHVHEEGIRFSTLSQYPQSPYACVSVEPGIYLKDKGGVRIENVVLLIPEGAAHYRYENVVYVGYDWDLIDMSRLTENEKAYLKAYEARCRELGTQLTECPLE